MSWNKAELTSVCEVFSDGDWIESKDQSEDGIRLIQTGNVGFGRFKARDSKARYISEETFKRLRCTEIKYGDILVSRLPDPVGRACVIPKLDEKSITAVDCTIIRTKKEILSTEFLNYFCQSPQYFEQVKRNITGATRQRISRSLLGKTEIPLPPLATQKKIVAKLGAIFAEIDKATASAEANAKNAEALFQSYLTQVFERGGNGWRIDSIGNICEDLFAGGDVPKERMSKDRCNQYTIPIFTNGEKDKGLYGFTDNARVTKPSITVSARGTIGYSQVRDEPFFPAIRLIVATPNPEIVLLNFLKYAIKSIRFIHSGASIPQLTVPMIRNYSVALPSSMEEQQRIIKKIDALSQQIEKLKIFEESKAKKFSLLKQSILKQAFAGELVKE